VKLGKDASDTSAMLSQTYGGEAMKKSSVFGWHKQFKERPHVEITNEDSTYHFLHFEFISQGQTVNQSMWKYFSSYVKLCIEEG
jgi:hypothetical protein